jgi:hypothetical protein
VTEIATNLDLEERGEPVVAGVVGEGEGDRNSAEVSLDKKSDPAVLSMGHILARTTLFHAL